MPPFVFGFGAGGDRTMMLAVAPFWRTGAVPVRLVLLALRSFYGNLGMKFPKSSIIFSISAGLNVFGSFSPSSYYNFFPPYFTFETNHFPNHQESSWLCSMTATEKEIFGSEFSPNTHKLPNYA